MLLKIKLIFVLTLPVVADHTLSVLSSEPLTIRWPLNCKQVITWSSWPFNTWVFKTKQKEVKNPSNSQYRTGNECLQNHSWNSHTASYCFCFLPLAVWCLQTSSCTQSGAASSTYSSRDCGARRNWNVSWSVYHWPHRCPPLCTSLSRGGCPHRGFSSNGKSGLHGGGHEAQGRIAHTEQAVGRNRL